MAGDLDPKPDSELLMRVANLVGDAADPVLPDTPQSVAEQIVALVRGEAVEVFLVTYSDWDEHWIASVWTTKAAAEEEEARLQKEHKKQKRAGNFSVEAFDLDARYE